MKKNNLQTRERILLAAQKEFAARGYAGARMEAIAREAAINKAMFFITSPPKITSTGRFCWECSVRFSAKSAALFLNH